MKYFVRTSLICVCAAVSAPCSAQGKAPELSWAYSQGFLTTFIDLAEAAAVACKPFSKSSNASLVLQAWLERNKELIQATEAAGLRGTKPALGKTAAEVFREMRAKQKVRVLAGFGPQLGEDLCAGQAEGYRQGVLELRYFPDHLRAAGVAVPAR